MDILVGTWRSGRLQNQWSRRQPRHSVADRMSWRGAMRPGGHQDRNWFPWHRATPLSSLLGQARDISKRRASTLKAIASIMPLACRFLAGLQL